MLNVFALAIQSNVPEERKSKVGREAGYGAIA